MQRFWNMDVSGTHESVWPRVNYFVYNRHFREFYLLKKLMKPFSCLIMSRDIEPRYVELCSEIGLKPSLSNAAWNRSSQLLMKSLGNWWYLCRNYPPTSTKEGSACCSKWDNVCKCAYECNGILIVYEGAYHTQHKLAESAITSCNYTV